MDNENQAVIKAKRISRRDNEPYYIATDGTYFYAVSELTVAAFFAGLTLTGQVIYECDEEFDG